MEKSEQKVVVVNERDDQLGVFQRDTAEKNMNYIIRVVYILLFNDDNQILIQRRSADSERFPNYWEVSASGTVLPDEGYVEAAKRKLLDELGITLPLRHEHKDVMRRPDVASHLAAIFVGHIQDSSTVKFNTEKISEVRWVTPKEAREGYLVTPSFMQVLDWWEDHGEEVKKNVLEA